MPIWVVARFVLAQLGADACQQHGKFERLADIVISAGIEPQHRIGIGGLTGQHDDRVLEPVLAHDPHRLAPVHVGQAHVHDDEIGRLGAGHLQRLGRRIGLDGREFFVQIELAGQSGAQIDVIVGDEDFSDQVRCRSNWALGEATKRGNCETQMICAARYSRNSAHSASDRTWN